MIFGKQLILKKKEMPHLHNLSLFFFNRVFCTMLSVWNLCSFVMRMFLTGRPVCIMISFRSFIELATTYPFLISTFIENGQFLYGNYLIKYTYTR